MSARLITTPEMRRIADSIIRVVEEVGPTVSDPANDDTETCRILSHVAKGLYSRASAIDARSGLLSSPDSASVALNIPQAQLPSPESTTEPGS